MRKKNKKFQTKSKIENSTSTKYITFDFKKMGITLMQGASNNLFYLLKVKSQIWEDCFREETKKFQITVKKSIDLTFSRD